MWFNLISKYGWIITSHFRWPYSVLTLFLSAFPARHYFSLNLRGCLRRVFTT
ncbi:hypothetical protein PUN28_010949 [Cardiocondyla obscurior]|uniref:Uncharacterized protein n=1 Tax=Cardiocondyla obscurior TaxID=286306 RepID=A0AAW2FPA7_9HYME